MISFPSGQQPLLVVLIDVEEEFDWEDIFDRGHTTVTHYSELWRAEKLCADFGIRPVCVCSYPVADHPDAASVLGDMAKDDRIVVGSHLHPWVSPPYEEEVCSRNSFPGNLDRSLEEAKLQRLTDRIEEAVGERPRVYQAGRYGIGPRTARILSKLGYAVDMSVCPPFDFREEGGPDFSADANDPFWFDEEPPVLALPVTGAFLGFAGRRSAPIFRLATARGLRWARIPAVLSRLKAVERIRLSPEGHTVEDLKRLTAGLLAQGVRVFTFSFHSPSLKPGCTEYVQSEAERDAFLDTFRAYFDYFMGEVGGKPADPIELYDSLLAGRQEAVTS